VARSDTKAGRLGRIFRRDGRAVLIALDHGGFIGPAPGLVDPEPAIRAVLKGGADAVMTTLGITERYSRLWKGKAGLVLSTPMVADMRPTADAALRVGADALKTFVTVGTADDSQSLANLWNTSVACKEVRMPFLAEIFPVKSEKTPDPMGSDVVAKFSRIGFEYGADIIKTFYTGSVEAFRAVTESCPVPVLILGGAKMETDRELLQTVSNAIEAGAGGVAFGRNIWQHSDPEAITKAIVGIVHSGLTVDTALELI